MSKKPKKYIYHIILTSNGKEIEDLYHSSNEMSVFSKFNDLVEENNKNIVFPTKYINNKGLKDANYEIIIIKSRNEKDPEAVKLRDEYGRYINYVSSNSDWIILNRAPYQREETFWVFGHHPQLDRKNFTWIYENLIHKNCDKFNFKNVMIYRNKLIVECNGSIEMVLCKNISDTIRLFNELEMKSIKDKKKYIMWSGDMTHSAFKKDLIDKLLKLTGWNYNKLRRNSLRP